MKITIVDRKPIDGVKKTIERMRYYRSLSRSVKEVKHTLWNVYSRWNDILKENIKPSNENKETVECPE